MKFNIVKHRKDLLSDFLKMASGSTIAQIIAVGMSPVITRLYGPEVFGIVAALISVCTLSGAFATLSYHMAIVLPKVQLDAVKLAIVSGIAAAGFSLFLVVTLIYFGEELLQFLGFVELGHLIFFIPVFVFSRSIGMIFYYWQIRFRQYSVLAKSIIIKEAVSAAAKLGFGLNSPTAFAFVFVVTSAEVLYTCLVGVKSRLLLSEAKTQLPSLAETTKLANRYREFPLFRMPNVVLNESGRNVPVLLLAALFDPSFAGFYAIARRTLGMPSRLVGEAIGSVFYPRLTAAAHAGRSLRPVLVKSVLLLAAVGSIPCLVLVFWGVPLFSFVFGEEWGRAGEIAQWLVFFFMATFANRVCVQSIPVIGLTKSSFYLELFGTVLRVLAILSGYYLYNDAMMSVILFAIVSIAYELFFCIYVLYFAKSPKGTF